MLTVVGETPGTLKAEDRPVPVHSIPLQRLNQAIRLIVRGFGSSEQEVEAVVSALCFAPPAA